MRTFSYMETNLPLSAFATALFLALATPACAASLAPTEPHVPAAYVPAPPPADETTVPTANGVPRPPLPAIITARAFGESRNPQEPVPVARVPFLAPDATHAGAEPCRLVSLPSVDEEASATIATDAPRTTAPPPATLGSRPPSVTVTGFRSRAPVDIAWAFPVPPSRNGQPAPAAPTGKTLVQMALFDAMPSPDAKPRSVVQCTSEIDSIAWAVPRAMVDALLGAAPPPGAVVRVSVARAPGKLAEMPKTASAPRFAVGAFVDLPVDSDARFSRR